MPKRRKVLRSTWPRVTLNVCVDSRKTGFVAGNREFFDDSAEALATAEQVALVKDNENFCRREGKWIAANPTENIKVRVKNDDVKILNVDQVKKILDAASNSSHRHQAEPKKSS